MKQHDALDLLVDVLTAARIGRLISEDTITEDVRERVVEWLDTHGHHKLADGITCQHCTTVWAALVLPWLPRRLRWALAVSAGAAWVAQTLIMEQEATKEMGE